MIKIKRVLRNYLIFNGFLLTLFIFWSIAGWPFFFDRLLIQSQLPAEAEYIVCIGGGLTTALLPTDDGWPRIYTAVQLYLDGYGRKILFTGGGAEKISEAEVYAEAAHWFGLPEEDVVFDPGPNQTSEHPLDIQKIAGLNISRATPLNIVTSALHSKRTALCFKKNGYTNFRLVTGYTATGKRVTAGKTEEVTKYLRAARTSKLENYTAKEKAYNDVFMRLRRRTSHFFSALREISAIVVYKVKGYI